MNEIKSRDISEIKKTTDVGIKTIKPENGLTKKDADKIVSNKLDKPSVANNEIKSNGEMIKNKEDGLRRENEVYSDLKTKYPNMDITSEAYLRDKNGSIKKDPITGEARRVDFVVSDGKKVINSIEVTSLTADKTDQIAKENRIRNAGGNYIRDCNGNVLRYPNDLKTTIERRQ